MQLLYDPRDDAYHERLGSQILYWLDDLGALPLDEADRGAEGFLFAGARPIEDYHNLIAAGRLSATGSEEREPLLRLDAVLHSPGASWRQRPVTPHLAAAAGLPLPDDLSFPLFVRTAESSWKKGGLISRVRTPNALEDEAAVLRRALGWNAIILAREWLDLATAGEGRYGPVAARGPHLGRGRRPRRMVVPLPACRAAARQASRLRPMTWITLRRLAGKVGSAFRSRLVVADFARDVDWPLVVHRGGARQLCRDGP